MFGKSPFDDVAVRRRIGYAPEHEKTWDELTALELVTVMAKLAGRARVARAQAAAEHALAQMGMTDAMHRRVKGFSQGHAPAHEARDRDRPRSRTSCCSTSR